MARAILILLALSGAAPVGCAGEAPEPRNGTDASGVGGDLSGVGSDLSPDHMRGRESGPDPLDSGRGADTTPDAGADVKPPPEGMVEIPAGVFKMGNPFPAEGADNELPVHDVYVSAFYMDVDETPYSRYDTVRTWANKNGYDLKAWVGKAQGPQFPVSTISWYDAVKYCNARSEMLGYTPVYYTDAAHTKVYRAGSEDLLSKHVKWNVRGFRLPTEAEMEKAIRGGLVGHRFPWPSKGGTWQSHCTGDKANYCGSGDPWEEDVKCTHGDANTTTSPCGYYDGNQVPKGSDMANGYGLYDMAGNVWNWCWDMYAENWYENPRASAKDTRGPDPEMGDKVTGTPAFRMFRGNSADDGCKNNRASWRWHGASPSLVDVDNGVRCVMTK